MKAMLMGEIASLAQNPAPLSLTDMPEPKLGEGEVLIRVTRCGVCHTELDEIEGRTPPPRLPVVLGHQVVGTIVEQHRSSGAKPPMESDQRVGVAWIASACGHCEHCLAGNENLCAEFKATGRDVLMTTKVDPTLIAGAVARMGGTVYDGSVATQLSKLRDKLLQS